LDIPIILGKIPFSMRFYSRSLVFHGGLDIDIKWSLIVINNLFCWLMVLDVPSPFMTESTLSILNGGVRLFEDGIFTELRNEIVSLNTIVLLRVLILITTGGTADWVRFEIDEGAMSWHLNCPLIGITVVIDWPRHVPISIVILNWGPLTVLSFLLGDMVLGILNILVLSKAWYKIINWMTRGSLKSSFELVA